MRDLSFLSSLIDNTKLQANGNLKVSIADDLFLNKVHSILSTSLVDYLDSSNLLDSCIILRLKQNLPDYDLLKLLRSLKLPMNERGKFIILNKES